MRKSAFGICENRAQINCAADQHLCFSIIDSIIPVVGDIYSPKVLVIPRNRWFRLNMTEKLFTGTLNHN